MWTPRRILFALLGLLVVAGGYFGYARLLGTFDGLPPLPDSFGPPDPNRVQRTIASPTQGNSLDRKFELAFGQNCSELRFPMRLEMKQKGILMASYKFEIIKSGPREGWVEASPLSLASVSERRGPDGVPEVNTVYCDVAYIKFDKLLRSMSDFEGRKIVACELHADPEARLADPRKGRVRLLNNRRTLDLNDDIEMVTPGPVYYNAEPQQGQPHIYTLTEVQIFDHLNTDLPVPDHTAAKAPTMSGIGLTVFLSAEAKDKQPKKSSTPPANKKSANGGVSGVDSVGLTHTVEMNLWTDANASFVAPGKAATDKKTEPPKKALEAKKGPEPIDKRLLQVKTNGPFRYDLNEEIAHFEKPAKPRLGLIEHVTVTRTGRNTGQDLLDCEFLDVHFLRKKPPVGAEKDPPPKKDKEGENDGQLEIKMIRAWGETVVITSDAENLRATGSELIHDAVAKSTVLKGDPQNQMQAVKDGNLIRGSELHMYGDGKEITQAHILGLGSIGIGEIDPKTGEYLKQAFWTDRLVYQRVVEPGQPPLDVFTFIGKDGTRAKFKDTSEGKLQEIEGQQLKVWLKSAEKDKDGKKPVAKKPIAKKKDGKDAAKVDSTASVRPLRLEGTGDVRSVTPELIIRRADYLNVVFNDVPKLLRPPKDKEPAKGPIPAPKEIPTKTPPEAKQPPEVKQPTDPKAKEPKKDEPAEKVPFIIVARSIEAWVNRDADGHGEIDRVHAVGDVEARQDAPKNEKGKLGNDVAGQTVDVQAYAEGYKMTVIGDPANRQKPWGVVRVDTLTLFGYDIVIDQRHDTAMVKGEGSMEVISKSNLEGKALEQASIMYVFWKQRMDFMGAEKLIYYHGAVQAYQDLSKLKCEWMQVLLDRPVYIDPDRRAKAKPAPKPGAKDEEDNPKIDTVMCFNAPKDEDAPRPKVLQPVTAIDEVMENGKLIKFQSIQAPEIVTVNTPLEGKRTRRDIHATAVDTMPGMVRMWQAGQKDVGAKPKEKAVDPKKSPPLKKGELAPDQEMKLTIVQYGEKMRAEDLRKRAKFWTNVRVVHLAAESPTIPVDLREGDIPKGAVYMEARDTLEVFTTPQKERDAEGKEVVVEYQEMIAIGNVRVRKQGEFFGDADRVTYSELKDTLTFHGTEKNPAIVNQIRGQGIPNRTMSGKTIVYYLKSKTMGTTDATQIRD